jgi:hypothetical protein
MTEYLAAHAQSKGCLGVFGQNPPIDYARIQLESDFARQILSPIQEHDQNQV